MRFAENFERLLSTFRALYPPTSIAYSYKTNYIPRFCGIISQLGGYAEVVSGMEMALALKLGIPASEIFFNGPCKETGESLALLRAGGTVNVDNIEELERIAAATGNGPGEIFRIGIRCNFAIGDDPRSRFGIDVDDRSFARAVATIDKHPRMRLIGLHCHFASRSIECWENRTHGMLSTIDRYFGDRLSDLEYVSLGGGMYGDMPPELSRQFSTSIPTFADYANVAAANFAAYFGSSEVAYRPQLIIEPGTALVADAMQFVCQVDSIKRVGNRTIAAVTGSTYNINPNPNRKNVPILRFANPHGTGGETLHQADLAGYTCIENDRLYHGYCGNLSVGDYLVFNDVGAYSIVMKPPFIQPNVAVIEPTEDGCSYAVIKRRERFEDIFSGFTAV